MKSIVTVLILLLSFSGMAQKIKFKISGQKDTIAFLVKYNGKGMFYADTAEMKNGVIEFNTSIKGKEQKPGLFALFLRDQKCFDFIFNNEEVYTETKAPDYVNNMVVKKSEENKVFIDYLKFISDQRTKAADLGKKRDTLKKDDPEYKKLTEEIETISKSVEQYQLDLVKNNPTKFVSKLVKMSMDVKIPEAPRDSKGNIIDSSFAYKYYRDHYFDNIDLKDDRILNTPIFHNKLEEFFGKKMLIQHPDTLVKYGYWFIDQLDPKSEVFKYSVTHITSTAEKSNIMGMDKVFVRMGQRYYCAKNLEGKSPAYWMAENKLADLCEKVETQKNLVQGVVPPNVILLDTTDTKWVDYYSIKADYTILYFWDPECGHCKTSTPKLQKLYSEKLKARNVEVFAVGKAVGEDFEKWKKFIIKHNLTFVNVALTDRLYREAQKDARKFVPKFTTFQSLNYQETFDIFSTPRIFVLDKDKKIIAKQLSISQLEDFLDRLQNYKGPKIIEPDPEDEKH
ncbi:MAG: alkyl hydroperoxide reductase/Thiol specific antioxidant/Mal allergen [Crocinitomicaceae bacterium]|jgi:thiol-disulfide isomerase/thioredoxin|nr:alkyl hydroperoxide reductase/Thiol specific antioxidant/Mal allergen [Crocinitomicaceae bacterium]